MSDAATVSVEGARRRMLRCPQDGARLGKGSEHGFLVHPCHSCRGLWITGSEWCRLTGSPRGKASRTGVLPEVSWRPALICPSCSRASLTARSARGIEVDQCSNCRGVWLDADEVELFLARGREQKRSPVAKGFGSADGWGSPVQSMTSGDIVSAVGDVAGASVECAGELLVGLLSSLDL